MVLYYLIYIILVGDMDLVSVSASLDIDSVQIINQG